MDIQKCQETPVQNPYSFLDCMLTYRSVLICGLLSTELCEGLWLEEQLTKRPSGEVFDLITFDTV